MEYYIYLLQIFGGGNPKIHEVIRACGSVRNAYERISGGDMSLIPSNRRDNARQATLERSKAIINYCRENNIGIVTIDDKDYPDNLKNIFDPPVVLFVSGNIGCLDKKLAIAVVGPREPSVNAVRMAENICYNLARCDIVLVSGFAKGVDRIAHNNSIRHSKPTVAVLACGMTVDYPAGSFGLRKEIADNGGAIISELLPDTPCNSDYFKFRNRIISGLSQGTAVVGAYNHSGSLLTANHAFEQDRELFFTVPEDTLDKRYSRIVRYLRDGAHPVFDFYDIVNEFYPTYRDVIDDTYLDKEQLTSFVMHNEQEERPSATVRSVPTDETVQITQPAITAKDNTSLKKARSADIPRFKITSVTDKEKEIDYFRVTPENVLKKHRKVTKPKSEIKPVAETKTIVEHPIRPAETESVVYIRENVTEQSSGTAANAENITAAAEILGIIANSDGVTLDALLSACSLSFGELSEILADLEISGAVSCGAGGIYTVKKER